jgi:hypothetical protein
MTPARALPRIAPAAALVVCCFAPGIALAADWVERPYNPPVGSRWTIEDDLSNEQDDNGRISKKTFNTTSELKIVGKDAGGFHVVYARRAASYNNDDKDEEAMARPAIAALQGIEYRVTTDLAGKPLRVDNLDDVKAAVRRLISGIASGSSKDPKVAAAMRQVLAPMLDIDEKSAAELYMDQLPILALAQNTGLKPGETRRDSVAQINPIGKLVVNRTLTLTEADPASGDAKFILVESYDPEGMRAFQTAFLERLRQQGADVSEPEKTVKELELTLDKHSEFKVVGGMTRNVTEDSTMVAKLVGTKRAINSRKVVTIAEAR